jgi:hypothetical protein
MIHRVTTKSSRRTPAPGLLPYNFVDERDQRFLRLGAVPPEMGDGLDGLGTGPLSDRKRIGAPDLRFAFLSPETGARDQSFRLIIRTNLCGRQVRLRFSNALGTQAGHLRWHPCRLAVDRRGACRQQQPAVRFAGKSATTLAPTMSLRSEPVPLPFVHDPAAALLRRKLAISSYIVGESGPMTWQAKADGIPHDRSRRRRQGRKPRTRRCSRSAPRPDTSSMRST